jgi:hypothetical protein
MLSRQLEGLKADAEWRILAQVSRELLIQVETMLNNYLTLIAEIRAIASDNPPQ